MVDYQWTDEEQKYITSLIMKELVLPSTANNEQNFTHIQPNLIDGELDIVRVAKYELFDHRIVVICNSQNVGKYYVGFRCDITTNEVWSFDLPSSYAYFALESDELLSDFEGITTLPIDYKRSRSKGDIMKNGLIRSNTSVKIDPSIKIVPGGNISDCAEMLLDYLDTDQLGITQLLTQGQGYIMLVSRQWSRNGDLRGLHLSSKIITRISNYGLEFHYDSYTSGRMIE